MLEFNGSKHSIAKLFSLEEKVALVTGGAGYLGRAISEALVEAGAMVAIASRDQSKCQDLADELNEKFELDRAAGFKIDIRDQGSIETCLKNISNEFGEISVLINNAAYAPTGTLEELTKDQWIKGVNSTLTGAYNCTKKALPQLKNGVDGGVVINIASMYGIVAPDFGIYEDTDQDNPPSYGASKAGIIQFTRYAASELAKYDIRVNSLSPGPFPNQNVQKKQEFIQKLKERTMLGRIGRPWELKGAIVFLSSRASSYMTGQNLVIDGGWTAW